MMAMKLINNPSLFIQNKYARSGRINIIRNVLTIFFQETRRSSWVKNFNQMLSQLQWRQVRISWWQVLPAWYNLIISDYESILCQQACVAHCLARKKALFETEQERHWWKVWPIVTPELKILAFRPLRKRKLRCTFRVIPSEEVILQDIVKLISGVLEDSVNQGA